MACIVRCLDPYHRLYVLNFALSLMVPTPLELTDAHGHREYQHRSADNGHDGDNGVQCDTIR